MELRASRVYLRKLFRSRRRIPTIETIRFFVAFHACDSMRVTGRLDFLFKSFSSPGYASITMKHGAHIRRLRNEKFSVVQGRSKEAVKTRNGRNKKKKTNLLPTLWNYTDRISPGT